jgi:DDE superfamily endonuclease
VLDNLNTHKPEALYERFDPETARRVLRKVEFYYTPKHGSWLNMAEVEISVLQAQCLNRYIPSQDFLKKEVATWELARNAKNATITWNFTVPKAREKMTKAYMSLQSG